MYNLCNGSPILDAQPDKNDFSSQLSSKNDYANDPFCHSLQYVVGLVFSLIVNDHK